MLLAKHLKLDPQRALIIHNVMIDSPADIANLERDDIITGFQGEPINGHPDFIDRIRTAGIGAEVTLQIIRNGDPKEITLTLAAADDQCTAAPDQWKHPFLPSMEDSRIPGRIFRMEPGQEQWREIPSDKLPEMDDFLNRFFHDHPSLTTEPGDLQEQVDDLRDEMDGLRNEISSLREEMERLQKTKKQIADQIERLPESSESNSQEGEF